MVARQVVTLAILALVMFGLLLESRKMALRERLEQAKHYERVLADKAEDIQAYRKAEQVRFMVSMRGKEIVEVVK